MSANKPGNAVGPRPMSVGLQFLSGFGILCVILGFIGIVASGNPNSTPAPRASWEWKASSPGASGYVSCSAPVLGNITCTFKVSGVGSAQACWDVVVECGATTHRAHICSRLVPTGTLESYSATSFYPVFSDDERCTSERVENIVAQ